MFAEADKVQYLTVSLFCNWSMHISLTESSNCLKILAKINDVLVRIKSSPVNVVRREMSEAIGFGIFRSELVSLLGAIGVNHNLRDDTVFRTCRNHLIEIIRDVPIEFPPLGTLKKLVRQIYNQIIQNPIKSGAGVTSIKLSLVDYGTTLGGEMMCLTIRLEDTTSIVVPLEV